MFQVPKIGSKSVEEFVSRFFLFKLAVHRIHKFEMSSQLFFMKLELLVRPAMLSLKDFHPIKGMSAYDVRGLILR